MKNFDVVEKTEAGFGLRDTKLMKLDQFQTKYIFVVD